MKEVKKVSSNELTSLMFFVSNSKDIQQREDLIGNYTINGFNILIRKNRPLTPTEKYKRLYNKRRVLGLCIRCGEKSSINMRTNLPYRLCEKHRKEENDIKWQKRKNKTSSKV